MPIYGTQNQYGVPTIIEMSIDGTYHGWGTSRLHSISSLSNSAESIDGKYKISDCNFSLIDTDGSVWSFLGNGTSAFNKDVVVTARVGGTVNYTGYGNGGTHLTYGTGGNSFVLHQGRITNVSKKNRLVTINSKTRMRLLADMDWQFPWTNTGFDVSIRFGSYLFTQTAHKNVATRYGGFPFDINDTRDRWTCWGALTNTPITLDVTYPQSGGRFTIGLAPFNGINFTYPGTQWYVDYPRFKLEGSYLDVYTGTITTTEEANRFGYANTTEAELDKTGGTYYPQMTRFTLTQGTLPPGYLLYLQQTLTLTDTPTNIYKFLVAGAGVYPYFNTNDIDGTTFDSSKKIVAYQTFSRTIDPDKDKPVDCLKDLIQSSYSLFNINEQNKFEFRTYGPYNLTQTVGTIPAGDILECEYTNAIDDYYNRVIIQYGWNTGSSYFTQSYEKKAIGWTIDNDRPYRLDSKWLVNQNEVAVTAGRLLSRFKNTIPHVTFSTPLNYIGVGMGSLLSITDVDAGVNGKLVQIVGYDKDVSEGRTCRFEAIDGEALFRRKGYCYWGRGTSLPGETVSGTSNSGWGTQGTVHNINTTIYGTQFVWW